jgi:RNA polymerase sigma-B factor
VRRCRSTHETLLRDWRPLRQAIDEHLRELWDAARPPRARHAGDPQPRQWGPQTSGRARSGGQDERPVRGRGRGVGQAEPFDDIYQVACYAVVKAVDRFDLGRGRAFTSYAVPTIVGEIKRHFRDRTWAVRVPRDLQELSLRVDRAVNELTRTLGRQPSVDEVADAIEVEPEDVVEAMEAGYAYRANSLDGPRVGGDDEDGATLADTLGSLDEGFACVEDRVLIADLLRSLPVRERQVLRMTFDGGFTQSEIGERIGVSQMQVSRILRSTLARLHTLVTAADLAKS